MPPVMAICRERGYSPSRVLMLLAFGSLLGGTLTLIGTPPNLIIAGYRAEAGEAPFGMFAFLPVGAAVTVAGVLFILALRGLSHPTTSRQGNMYGMIGMAIAVVTTLLVAAPSFGGGFMILAGIAIGGSVGAYVARNIAMTAMPQLVAGFHVLAFTHHHVQHLAGDVRGDQHLLRADIGVVGGDVAARAEPDEDADRDHDQWHHDQQDGTQALAREPLALRLRGVGLRVGAGRRFGYDLESGLSHISSRLCWRRAGSSPRSPV